MTVFLRTLGSPQLATETGEQLLPKGKPLALLAYCAADRRRVLSRDECASLLWSDMEPERARHSVRQAIWRLRKVLGEVFLTRDDLITGVGPDLVTDRDRFLEAVHASDATAALELYTGPFLDGMVLPGGDEFDDWLQFERHRLEEALVLLVERAADTALAEERRTEARTLAEQLVARAPNHTGARRLLVEVLFAAGDPAAARQEADALEAELRRDGGDVPPRIASTLARVRAADVGVETPTTELTFDFVGRDAVFADVLQGWREAQQGTTRLFLMTGAAGIGKSRFLQVVQRRCSVKGTRALLVRANVGEQAVPYGYAAMLVRTMAQLPGAAGVSEESARELAAIDPSLVAVFRTTPAAWNATESPRRRALAVLDLLQAVAEQKPLALLLDDWHWMDTPSRDLLTVTLGRCEGVPLLVMIASRSAQDLPSLDAAQRLVLSPLDLEEILEALRSTGTWPSHAEAAQFLGTLATASRGVPLDLYERLNMVIEGGALTLHAGAWQADSWASMTRDVAAASPLVRRLAACSALERDLLLVVATAGVPMAVPMLHRAVRSIGAAGDASASPLTREQFDGALQLLESKLLLRQDGQQVQPSHDTVAEAMLESVDRAERRTAHAALAAAFEHVAVTGTGATERVHAAEYAYAALRHALLADEMDRAGRQLARVVGMARERGDKRSAHEILVDVTGSLPRDIDEQRVLRAVPLWQRWRRPSGLAFSIVSLLIAVLASFTAWRVVAAPVVQLVQTPSSAVGTPSYGDSVYRPVPAPLVGMARELPDSTLVSISPIDGRAEVVAGGTAYVIKGQASLASLRVRLRDTSAVLRVTAPGHRPAAFTVRQGYDGATLVGSSLVKASFVEATFGGTRLDSRNPELTVRAGQEVEGVVQARYTAMFGAASVWLSYTPSWGVPAEQMREYMPVTTPTLDEGVDVPVRFVAPARAGRYWLLFVVAGEPSGGFALSATNWSVERPIWGDGNDVAQLPDSVIERASREGFARLYLAFPREWKRTESQCRRDTLSVRGDGSRPPRVVKYCENRVGLFGIRVVVQ